MPNFCDICGDEVSEGENECGYGHEQEPPTTDATLRKINHYLTALENELNTGPVPVGISGDASKAALADLMLIARDKDPAHHEDRLSTFDSENGTDMTDEAPKQIWAEVFKSDEAGQRLTIAGDRPIKDGVGYSYTLTTHALALVAEAYEVAGEKAADQERACTEWFGKTGSHANVYEQLDIVQSRISKATPADAQAAREARDAEVRRKALEEAVQYLQSEQDYYADRDGQLDLIPFDQIAHICRVMACRLERTLIEKGQTDE